MVALVAIIIIDILVMAAVLYFGRKHDEHPVSLTAPSIQALTAEIRRAEAEAKAKDKEREKGKESESAVEDK